MLIVYMGAMYIYIDVYMGGIYMYNDCVYGCYLHVYGCYIHVYRLCIWVLYYNNIDGVYDTLNSVCREIVSILTIVSCDKVGIKHSDDFIRTL